MNPILVEPWKSQLPFTVRFHGVSEEQFDELVDEDVKAELLDGEMIVHSPASPRHGDRVIFLGSLMRLYADANQLGLVMVSEVLVRLKSCRKVAPDIFFIRRAKLPEPLPQSEFKGAPDLVVEVLSPSNRYLDLEEKRPMYRQAGVAEVWFVDPDQEVVTVDQRRKTGYSTKSISTGRITSTALKGFWIEAEWLWASPLPNAFECLQKILGGDS